MRSAEAVELSDEEPEIAEELEVIVDAADGVGGAEGGAGAGAGVRARE
jgi:hypothetical protein